MWFWLCLFTWRGMKAHRKGRAKTTKAGLHQLVRPQEMDRCGHRPAALQPEAPTLKTSPCTKHTVGRSGLHLGFDLNCLSVFWCGRSEPVLCVLEQLLKACLLGFVCVKRGWSWGFVIDCFFCLNSEVPSHTVEVWAVFFVPLADKHNIKCVKGSLNYWNNQFYFQNSSYLNYHVAFENCL